MPARAQRLHHVVADAVFDLHLFAFEEHARPVDRGLQVHAVIDDVGDDMRVAHRLIGAAHDPERHVDAAVAHRQRRNDGVQRPLRRADAVRMTGREIEARAAMMQQDAGLLRRNARAEDENSELIMVTALRSLSTTQTSTVEPCGFSAFGNCERLAGSIMPASLAAKAAIEQIADTGSVMKAGSAMLVLRTP